MQGSLQCPLAPLSLGFERLLFRCHVSCAQWVFFGCGSFWLCILNVLRTSQNIQIFNKNVKLISTHFPTLWAGVM